MLVPNPVVHIVDADEVFRRSTARLLQSAGYATAGYDSAEPLLGLNQPGCGCLLLDIDPSGRDGLQVQCSLRAKGVTWPVIFVTARVDIEICVRAIKGGAEDFLVKPIRRDRLLRAVALALARDATLTETRARESALRERFATLTAAERSIFVKVAAGMLNKQIAFDLGRSERTVKGHRARVMAKMHAGSVADLVRMADCLGANPAAGVAPASQVKSG